MVSVYDFADKNSEGETLESEAEVDKDSLYHEAIVKEKKKYGRHEPDSEDFDFRTGSSTLYNSAADKTDELIHTIECLQKIEQDYP